METVCWNCTTYKYESARDNKKNFVQCTMNNTTRWHGGGKKQLVRCRTSLYYLKQNISVCLQPPTNHPMSCSAWLPLGFDFLSPRRGGRTNLSLCSAVLCSRKRCVCLSCIRLRCALHLCARSFLVVLRPGHLTIACVAQLRHSSQAMAAILATIVLCAAIIIFACRLCCLH